MKKRKSDAASTASIGVRLTSNERDDLTAICKETGLSISELFRARVLALPLPGEPGEPADEPAPPAEEAPRAKPRKGRPRPAPSAEKKTKGMKDWPLDPLDNAVHASLAALSETINPVPLDSLIEAMAAREVLPGRIACSLHRLRDAGRIDLHHGTPAELKKIRLAFRRWLPTGKRDQPFLCATPLF